MHRFRISILLFLATFAACSSARADTLFDLARKPKQTTLLTTSESPPTPEQRGHPPQPARPPMLRRIDGILAELSPAQITELIAAAAPAPRAPSTVAPPFPDTPALPVCFVHITGPAGDRSIVITQSADGVYTARVIAPADAQTPATKPSAPSVPRADIAPVTLNAERFDHLMDAVGYTGAFTPDPAARPLGETFEVPKPYQIGAVVLDARAIRDRFGTGRYIRFDPVARVLQNEKLRARLPSSYDPKSPAGLLVWMDPSPDGRPPQPYWNALDRANIICIGAASAGNDRSVTDRLQLALDAVATAKRRWNIDDTRIYVSGVSGGGKMSAILTCCFPDVFTGAAPIVGIIIHENVPNGDGAKYWPAGFTRPTAKRWELLKSHRIAAITGDSDFNRDSIEKSTQALIRDKLDAKLFLIPGMGHSLPPEPDLKVALEWIDEPARTRLERARTAAAAALAGARAAVPAGQTNAYLAITRDHPWTPAAWEAADELHKSK